jgi:hypothetical protein
LLIYEDQKETQREQFELLKKMSASKDGEKPDEASGMTPIPESFGMALPQQSIKEWFDYSLLPPFDTIAKYYSFIVIGGGANADGLTWKVYSPMPAGLKK